MACDISCGRPATRKLAETGETTADSGASGRIGDQAWDSTARILRPYLAGQLAKGFARSLQQRATLLGFSPGQFPVLLELWQEDGLTPKQLLDKLEVEQATLANTLARMERDGLIQRTPHPTDRRAQIITLIARPRT